LRRGPSQVRKFLKGMGLKFHRVRPVPVPPKKTRVAKVAGKPPGDVERGERSSGGIHPCANDDDDHGRNRTAP
jgi:hypothetical protein